MPYELWRNKLSEGFFFSLDNVDYYAKPFGVVQIPKEFHNIPGRRGLALEFIREIDDDLMYMECLEGQPTPQETQVEIAQVLLSKPSKPKKKPTNGIN